MIGPLLKGFSLTFKHLFKKKVTVNYPYEKVPVFPKYRGKQVLMRDENGLEKCVACGLCSVACPADAIYLEAAENDGSVMAGPRFAKVYQIPKNLHLLRHVRGSLSVSAIFMGKDYELAVYSKDDFIWDKSDLLVVPRLWRRRRRLPAPLIQCQFCCPDVAGDSARGPSRRDSASDREVLEAGPRPHLIARLRARRLRSQHGAVRA